MNRQRHTNPSQIGCCCRPVVELPVDTLPNHRVQSRSRSRRKKVHFFKCQTGRFPEHLEPRHLGAYHGMKVFRQALRDSDWGRNEGLNLAPPPFEPDCLSQRDRHHPVWQLPPPRNNGIDSEAWRRKNDGVLECARQSAASTPLWSCPKRHTHSLPISSTASREEPRNPQRGHLRPLNEWPWREPSR